MSSPAKAHEPTMEEILASIRRIISDDELGSAAAAPARPGEAAKAPEAPRPFAPAAGPKAAADRGADDIDAMFAAIDFAHAAPQPKPAPPPAERSAGSAWDAKPQAPVRAAPAPSPPTRENRPLETERLLSPRADESVQAAFGKLADTVLADYARNVDEVAREMLRPMLKAWLDEHLPPLVERLVRQEIERVARGGR